MFVEVKLCDTAVRTQYVLPVTSPDLLRELGLQAGRHPDGFLEPAYARRDGPLEDVPNDEVPSMAWLHMAHTGPLPPIWDLLDLQPNAETLHLLSLVEFTDLLNGCAPDALVRNAFVILRMVATARYLHLKSQELREALMKAHVTIGLEADERVRPCPTSIKKPRLLSLSMLSAPGLPSGMPAKSIICKKSQIYNLCIVTNLLFVHCHKSIICNEVIECHKSIICALSQIYYLCIVTNLLFVMR
jgi:hypothetical protein